MPKDKQYVYSSRTTEKGLKTLNDLKDRLGVTWDELVTDAVCDKYHLDRAVIAVPKDTRREEERAAKKAAAEADKKAKAEKREKDRQEKLAKKAKAKNSTKKPAKKG